MGLEALAQGASDAHDDVRDIGMTYWGQEHAKEMQERQQENQMALNRQMANLAADARRDSVPAMVEGLKRAGLHPVLASGTSFGSVSSGGSSSAPISAPVTGSRGNLGTLALESLRYSQSERGLMDAQKRNLNAEAEGREIENRNRTTQNEQLDNLLRGRLEAEKQAMERFIDANGGDSTAIRESEQYKVIDTLLSRPINSGSVAALEQYFGSKERSAEHSIRILSDRLEKLIKQKQLYDPEFADKLAELPKHEADIAANSAAEIYANILYLAMARQLTEANINLSEDSLEQIKESINVMKHNDVVGLFESGDYDALGVKWLYDNLPKVLNTLGIAGAAATYGRRFKTGNKPAKVGETPMQMLGY